MDRRRFIIGSLDDHENEMFKAFIGARDKGIPGGFSPPRFFKPAYAAHVDNYGFTEETVMAADSVVKHLYGEWTKQVRQLPGSATEYMLSNYLINPQPITEAAYDGSKQRLYELDECSQWVQPWIFKKIDLNASIKKLLKMDVVFDGDHKKLLGWLKTRGKSIYLSGPEYHMLTNPGAYRNGLWYRSRRYGETFFNASFNLH